MVRADAVGSLTFGLGSENGRKAYWPNEPNAPQHQCRLGEALRVASAGVHVVHALCPRTLAAVEG